MFMTESEFQELLQKNPKLKVHQAKRIHSQPGKQRPCTMDALRNDGCVPEQSERLAAAPVAKYRNRKVFVYEDGFVGAEKGLPHGKICLKFDSEKEYFRYIQLSELERAGVITNLGLQRKFVIQDQFTYQGKAVRPITYIADFTYVKNGRQIVEDVKGKDRITGKYRLTEAFKLKWKLLKQQYPEYQFELF